MQIGSKVVLMRDKRYGIITRGRYSQAKIVELTARDYKTDETFTFTSGDETIIATKKHYGTLQFEQGWYAVYIDMQLPYQAPELAANLARYIESNRKAFVLHIGAHAGEFTLATAVVRDQREMYRFGSDEVSIDMQVILDKIDAEPGSLIACDVLGVNENEHGLISYKVKDIMVLTDKITLETVEQYRWPGIHILCPSELDELVLCHRLAKIDDEVLYYVKDGDVTVISSQGLRAHQSSDLAADAWGWGNGEADGFYVARKLAWAGSGEDVELEADHEEADDQEVARILDAHGFGSSELVDQEVEEATIRRIAAILGDVEAVDNRYAELDAKRQNAIAA